MVCAFGRAERVLRRRWMSVDRLIVEGRDGGPSCVGGRILSFTS